MRSETQYEGRGLLARTVTRIEGIFRRNGFYYAAMALAGLVGLGKSVLYGLVLNPENFGQLNLVNSLVPFAVFGLSRGIIEGVALELPRLYGLGRGDLAASLLIRSVRRFAFECVIVVVAVVAATLIGAPLRDFALATSVAASTGILSVLLTDARSKGNLTQYGTNVLVRVVACAAIGLVGAKLFGMIGAVIGEVVAQLILVVWLIRMVPAGKNASDADALSGVRRGGFKMMVHQLFQILQQNGDKWMISFALGAGALGQYSFAGIFLVAVSLIHAIVYQQIGPAALRSIAEGKSPRLILSGIERVCIGVGFGVAVMALITGILYRIGLDGLFVAYRSGFHIFPWIVLGAVLQSMNHFDWIVSRGTKMDRLMWLDFLVTALFLAIGTYGILAEVSLVFFAILACCIRFVALLGSWILARTTVRELEGGASA